ncbi:hypothetical protein N9F21_01925 [Porticoccaceae bacterium]|nr:hypothetical protein [Porticoccaceae bacterium]
MDKLFKKSKNLLHFELIRNILRWWADEIAQLLPEKLTHWLSSPEPVVRIVLYPDYTQLIMSEPITNVLQTLRFDTPISSLKTDHQFAEQIGTVVLGPVILELSPELILERDLELPEAAKNNYNDIICLQVERYLPMAQQDIHLATYLQQSNDQTSRISLKLAMVKKSLLRPLHSLLASNGAWVSSIKGNSATANHPPYQFADFSERQKNQQRKKLFSMIGITLGLACFVVVSGYYRLTERETYLRDTISRMSQNAKNIQVIESAINAAKTDLQFYQQKISQIDTTDVLLRLTELLPADSWVYEYNQSGDSYIISGKTTNASRLVQLLDQDPLFSEVSNSSTLSDPSDDRDLERFTLSFTTTICEEECP